VALRCYHYYRDARFRRHSKVRPTPTLHGRAPQFAPSSSPPAVAPLIVHQPAGIEQLAVYVGVVENPAALSGNVNEDPAAPVCDGVGVVTAGGVENVAVTEVFPEMLNAHIVLVLPLHAPPDQLVNVAPVPGTAVSVIGVPDANEVPVGDCVIVPGPLTVVVSVYCAAAIVAVSDVFAEILNAHVVLVPPLHAPPDQLVNVAPVFGTAVNVIAVPDANEVPVGDWVIVPGPFTLVVSEYCGAVKVADTVSFAVTITLHVVEFVDAQGPSQCENDAPGLGTAVRFTMVLFANDVPVGDCVIVPGPVTLVENVNFVTVVTPVPVNVELVSDPLGPLILSVPARPPKACGANVTVIEHDDPTAIGAVVQLLVSEKSPGFEPPIVIDDTVIGPVPVDPFCN